MQRTVVGHDATFQLTMSMAVATVPSTLPYPTLLPVALKPVQNADAGGISRQAQRYCARLDRLM